MAPPRTTTRRAAIGSAAAAATLCAPAAPLLAATDALPPLSPRLSTSQLSLLTGLVSSRPGVLRYPPWMLGTWRVRNTIKAFSMPLGSAFADPFIQAVAADDIASEETLEYRLRWVPATADEFPDLPAVQDRRFNAIEETQAFLGTDGGRVVGCRYSDALHGRVELEVADESPDDAAARRPPPSSLVALQIEWAQWEAGASGGAFVTSEVLRQRVTRAPTVYEPAQNDELLLESITRFERPLASTGVVRARNRIAQYSLAVDEARAASSTLARKLARLARLSERAVTVFDYDWSMERLPPGADGEGRGGAGGGALLSTPLRA